MWYLNYILNQKGCPAWYADTLANRPAAGYIGRLFVSTDTFAIYRDTGAGWDLIGGPGSGTITGTLDVNRVVYSTGSNTVATSANLLFDGTTLTTVNDIVVNGLFIGKGGGNIAGNSAVGLLALENNTTGTANTAIGNAALRTNTTGTNNIAVGTNALLQNNSNFNTAVGAFAVPSATGGFNTAIGANTLQTLFGGTYNIAVGYSAGGTVETGTENIFIGANTIASSASASNQIVIGYGAAAAAANTVVLGNNNILNTYLKGTVNAHDIAITKNTSGIALNITDTANGNAINITKSGSGAAISISQGVCNLLFTQMAATDGESLLAYNNSAAFTTGTIRNDGSGDILKVANNTTNILTVKNNCVLINTNTNDLVNKLQVNGGVLSQSLTINQDILGGVSATIRNLVTAGSGVTGYGLAVEAEASAATSYAFTVRNLTASQTYLHISTVSGSVGFIGINKTNPTEFLDVLGNILCSGSVKTGNPSGGTAAAWKLGSYVAVAAPAPTGYIEIDIAGTLYKIAAGT